DMTFKIRRVLLRARKKECRVVTCTSLTDVPSDSKRLSKDLNNLEISYTNNRLYVRYRTFLSSRILYEVTPSNSVVFPLPAFPLTMTILVPTWSSIFLLADRTESLSIFFFVK